jgi:hypothetical protein
MTTPLQHAEIVVVCRKTLVELREQRADGVRVT